MSKYPGGPTACSEVVETGTGGLIALEIITDCRLLYVVVFLDIGAIREQVKC